MDPGKYFSLRKNKNNPVCEGGQSFLSLRKVFKSFRDIENSARQGLNNRPNFGTGSALTCCWASSLPEVPFSLNHSMILNTAVPKCNYRDFGSQLAEVFAGSEHVQNQLYPAHKISLRYSYGKGIWSQLYQSKLLTTYKI